MKEFFIESFDGLKLFCRQDISPTDKAIVLVIHGMQEHSGRYIIFAQKLKERGFGVMLSDSRGHGKTMRTKDDYGKSKDIYAESVKDQQIIIDYLSSAFPNLPIYVFSHSYGSMIAQRLVQVDKRIKKAIISGTTCGQNISFVAGNILASVLCAFGLKNKRARLIEKLSLKKWGKPFGGNWLSRDEKVYADYLSDPLCGGSFPISFYRSLFRHMLKVNKTIGLISPEQKLLLMVGSADPVGENSRLVKKLYKKYLKSNIDCALAVFEGARHELINETCKDQVYEQIFNFYEK